MRVGRQRGSWPAFLGILLLPAWPANSAWRSETVTLGRGFRASSAAVAPSGRIGVAYGTTHAFYAQNDGTGWVGEVIDPDVCSRAQSLAFGPGGEPTVAYHTSYDPQLRLARRAGSWQVELVGLGGSGQVALAYDAFGRPAIAQTAFDGVWYWSFDGMAWTRELVDALRPALDESLDLVFDRAGVPHVSFREDASGTVHVASRRGPTWQDAVLWQPASGSPGGGASLAVDAFGNPTCAYAVPFGGESRSWELVNWGRALPTGPCRWSPSLAADRAGVLGLIAGGATSSELYYCRPQGSSWSGEQLLITGSAPSLSFDATNAAGASYFDDGLFFARRAAAGWTSEPIDPSDGFPEDRAPAVAVDGAGGVGVAWVGTPARSPASLRFARRQLAGWQESTVSDDASGDPALVFDRGGNPAVAYRRRSDGYLIYTAWDGAAWVTTPLDWSAGSGISMRLDPDGRPAIAYSSDDSTGSGLAYLFHDGVTWVPWRVDPEAGLAVDLAFDPDGRPAISYRGDLTPGQLRLARWDGRDWRIEVVVPTRVWGHSTALAFDPAGHPNIAYRAENGEELSLARWDGAAWQVEPILVGLSGGSQQTLALRIDVTGDMALAFEAGGLKLGRRTAGTWSFEDIDAGWRGSFAFSTAGQLWAAYSGRCSDLLVATSTGDAQLFRGQVPSPAPGWKTAALPLDSLHDDATAPFPVPTSIPGAAADPAPPGAELVLYRVLWPGDRPAYNRLRLAKRAAGLDLDY